MVVIYDLKDMKEKRRRKWIRVKVKGIHKTIPSSITLRGGVLTWCNLSFIRTQRVFWLCFIFHPPLLTHSLFLGPFISFYLSFFLFEFFIIFSHQPSPMKSTITWSIHVLTKSPLESIPRPFSTVQRKTIAPFSMTGSHLGLRWGRFG